MANAQQDAWLKQVLGVDAAATPASGGDADGDLAGLGTDPASDAQSSAGGSTANASPASQKEQPAGSPVDQNTQASLAAASTAAGSTMDAVKKEIARLRETILKEFTEELPDHVGDIEKELKQLDVVAAEFQSKLAHALEEASKATDAAGHEKAKATAKAEITRLVKYVNGEPLIAHLDNNPFGHSPQILAKFSAMAKQAIDSIR